MSSRRLRILQLWKVPGRGPGSKDPGRGQDARPGGPALVRRTRLLPAWPGWLGVLLAVALVVSGVGYLLPSSALAPAAYVSGPLLLVWVTATGISLGGRG